VFVSHLPGSRDAGRSQRGQVLIIAALAFAILLGVAALAVDFGSHLVVRRYVQNAADGAALAGAAELGNPDESLVDAQGKAASQAADYLDDNLNLGMSSAQLAALAGVLNSPNGYCFPNPADCSTARFQMWIYAPAPSTSATATTGLPSGERKVYLNPQKYPLRPRSMFVRVDQPGGVFFSRIFGSTEPAIGAQAVASPSGTRCAVAALKPRLGSPDNKLGIELNAAQVYVGRGDVCSNYSINWAGGGAQVIFTAPTTDQVVYLAEPAAQQGSPSVVGGTVDVLADMVEDPKYSYPLPGVSPAVVDRPPAAAFPSCVSAANVAAGKVECNASGWATVPPDFTLYPGKYQLIDIPNGKNVTLSSTCHPDDTTCRAGVYWFAIDACTGGNKGGLWLKGTSAPSSITGQGVLLVFDPYETNPCSVTFEVSSNSASLHLNDSSDMRTTANPGGAIPFVWYNPSDTDPLADPVTVWVRPNYVTSGTTYDLTSNPGSGSNVISFSSNPLISENGLIYAPEDNTVISGNGSASGVGQVLTWTITYSGSGTSLTQNFAGGNADRSRLVQ